MAEKIKTSKEYEAYLKTIAEENRRMMRGKEDKPKKTAKKTSKKK